MDDLRGHCNILHAATVLDSLSITQSLHTTSIKKWMDSGAVSFAHQRVRILALSSNNAPLTVFFLVLEWVDLCWNVQLVNSPAL